jgi:hypothetical protein
VFLIEKVLVKKPDMEVDEERKRFILVVGLLLAIPTGFVFAFQNLMDGDRLEGILVMSILPAFVINLIVLKTIENVLVVSRISAFLGLMLLFYELYVGGGNGYAFVWFFPVPLVVFFLFGKREGSIWILLSFIIALIFLSLNLSSHSYHSSFISRFLASYAMVAVFSFGIEASRHRYYTELAEEKERLEEATKQIKILSGLLPICSSCKKIRDDKGYWKQIEGYIHEHSEATFTHTVCPECVRELYPDYYLE